MEPLIRVQELYKSYRRDSLEIPVLRNINLEILPSEFIAFMGPSGSGKTTLLNLIAGIDKPTQGRILIGGVDVGELNETELAVWRSRNPGPDLRLRRRSIQALGQRAALLHLRQYRSEQEWPTL